MARREIFSRFFIMYETVNCQEKVIAIHTLYDSENQLQMEEKMLHMYLHTYIHTYKSKIAHATYPIHTIHTPPAFLLLLFLQVASGKVTQITES